MRAWSYLRFVIQQARNPRWVAASSGAHARNVPAVRSSRQKFWPRCSSPECGRPVPPDAVHDLCGRAGPYVALIRAPGHGGPCCPGTCPGCRACADTPRVEAGWCVRCGVCVGCCRVTVCWLCLRSVGVLSIRSSGMIRRMVLGWVRSFPCESGPLDLEGHAARVLSLRRR